MTRVIRDTFLASGLVVEDGHALDVGSVREHVYRSGRRATVAGLVHQKRGITRQRSGVAADVDDT